VKEEDLKLQTPLRFKNNSTGYAKPGAKRASMKPYTPKTPKTPKKEPKMNELDMAARKKKVGVKKRTMKKPPKPEVEDIDA
jgi:hypothetical protein